MLKILAQPIKNRSAREEPSKDKLLRYDFTGFSVTSPREGFIEGSKTETNARVSFE